MWEKGKRTLAGFLAFSLIIVMALSDYAVGADAQTAYAAEKTEAQIDAAGDTETQIDAAGDTEAQIDAAGDTEAQIDAAGDTEAQTDAAADTEVQTDAAADTEAQTDAAANTEVQTDAATDTEAQTESAADTEVQTETTENTEQQTNITPETEAGTDTTADAETEEDTSDEQIVTTESETELETATEEETQTEENILDAIYVSDLKAETVIDTNKAIYCISVKTEHYPEETGGNSRVRLEMVLPLETDQASFDIEAMEWTDDMPGYEASLTIEERMIGEREITCQVLNAFVCMAKTEESSEDFPAEITVEVPVVVMEPEKNEDAEQAEADVQTDGSGKEVCLQISAAMEENQWDGICDIHGREEKKTILTDGIPVDEFLEETGKSTLTGEQAEGVNWMYLRDSGWFEAYGSFAGYAGSGSADWDSEEASAFGNLLSAKASFLSAGDETDAVAAAASEVQVKDKGGTTVSEEDDVTASKTISGTELENVFDITLTVETASSINLITTDPDMAVVIVLDISNTMNSDFGNTTRYAAAMSAAEEFLDQFAAQESSASKVGFVAFNRSGQEIFPLQECASKSQANKLKNTMRTETGKIINADGYAASEDRFTNIEGGLNKAYDMLKKAGNQHKYIVFLSDGFPTTYTKEDAKYAGYSPVDPEGSRFKDRVKGYPCTGGTNYSDEGAIRARKKAAEIKNSGIQIFSIGVDIGGQTIQNYIKMIDDKNKVSTLDRTGTSYEIGSASNPDAYKNWLKNSIGSGYYYDSTNQTGLLEAFNNIFDEIISLNKANYTDDWILTDPVPGKDIEYIGFYDKNANLVFQNLQGKWTTGSGENTASFSEDASMITWNLAKSVCVKTGLVADGTARYTYKLSYRVRLKNENDSFVEGDIYQTNGTTTLTYRCFEQNNGETSISDPKTMNLEIPSVHGYVRNLSFKKQNTLGNPLSGAEFRLSHDTANCTVCRGDKKSSVLIEDFTAVSNASGEVSIKRIPSGHKYILVETKAPAGYALSKEKVYISVDYDILTMTVEHEDGTTEGWDKVIVNESSHELPETGGRGIILYIFGGIFFMTGPLIYALYKKILRKRGKQL